MIGRGISFSNPLAAALRAGRKTQTRRLLESSHRGRTVRSVWARVLPGERLWMKEQWTHRLAMFGGGYAYGSDPLFEGFQGDQPRSWKPARFMPFDACRAILTVEAVRTERLQEITDQDCIAEGVAANTTADSYPWWVPGLPGTCAETPRDAFTALWDEIHDHEDWQSNPEVVVLTFTVEHRKPA